MTYQINLGKIGECLACEYLVKKGYKIIDRNFRKPWGELDIITKAPDKTLVFIEVKTLKENPNIRPEEELTKSKLQKLKRTASLYVGNKQELIKENKGWQIDLITLTINKSINNLTIDEKNCLIKHYENIS